MSSERRLAKGPIPPGRPSETLPPAAICNARRWRARGGRRDPQALSGREEQDREALAASGVMDLAVGSLQDRRRMLLSGRRRAWSASGLPDIRPLR